MNGLMPRYCCPAGFLFPNLPLEQRLDAVAAAGIGGVELWARADRYRDLDVTSVSAEHVNRLCRDRGLSVVSLGAHPPTDTAHVRSVVALAAELGAGTVVIGCRGESVGEALCELRPAFAHAARAGVRIAVHNHVNGLILDADDMARLCATVDPQAGGLAFAPTHAVMAGQDPMDLIDRFGDRMLQLWLWDLWPGAGEAPSWLAEVYGHGREQFPGSGTLPFRRYLTAPGGREPGPLLNFMPHGVQEWPAERTVRALRDSLRWLSAREARAHDVEDGCDRLR
ncbi:MAG: sugar phosphate isomerase/epimerase [Spirochaetaceae bacterium]|nr:sugar phosphate isomerase/epimerase [Spirochaetaceae bacterium]